MENILSYLLIKKDIKFKELPFNELDATIFARLSYLQYYLIKGFDVNKSFYLKDFAYFVTSNEANKNICTLDNDYDLLRLLSESKRYENIKAIEFQNEFNEERIEQFFGIYFKNNDQDAKFRVIAYRGTDKSINGWKENFGLLYKKNIMSQKDAKLFLTKNIKLQSDLPIYIVGHSKGGNIAVYAASKVSEVKQNLITRIYTFDAPGFNQKFYGHSNFQNIKDKIIAFVPQTSVIGRLLETQCDHIIVYSNKKLLSQHNMYSWGIEGTSFMRQEKFTQISDTLNQKIESELIKVDFNKREEYVTQIYEILNSIEEFDASGKIETAKDIVNSLSEDLKSKHQLVQGYLKDFVTSLYEKATSNTIKPISNKKLKRIAFKQKSMQK